jgi:hypothetical protein
VRSEFARRRLARSSFAVAVGSREPDVTSSGPTTGSLGEATKAVVVGVRGAVSGALACWVLASATRAAVVARDWLMSVPRAHGTAFDRLAEDRSPLSASFHRSRRRRRRMEGSRCHHEPIECAARCVLPPIRRAGIV